MKAVVYHEFGTPDQLVLDEIEIPQVREMDVLVKVYAASVNWHDWHFLTGTPILARFMAGPLKPKNRVLGIDFSGRIKSVGTMVTQFQPGDEVFGSSSSGCFAEYVRVSAQDVIIKPDQLTFEEAAAVPGAATVALQGLFANGSIMPGQKVLINGASGGVGTFAVQIAKAFGANVTGVCSTRNLELVRSIGADHVVDYTQDDFTQKDQKYDLIFDVAAKLSFAKCADVLNPQGAYITSEFSPLLMLKGSWNSMIGDKKMIPLLGKPPNPKEQRMIKDLLENGKVTPIVDRQYSLENVPEALRYLKKGHTQGKIVISVVDE